MSTIENPEKIESISSNILLENEEYQIELILYSNDILEFKVKSNSHLASCNYAEKYNFEQIKEKASFKNKKDMKEVFQFYKKKFENKKISLFLSENKIMHIYYKTITEDEELEVKLELKKMNLERENIVDNLAKEIEDLKNQNLELKKKVDDFQILKNQFNELKKNYNLIMEEYNKKKEKENEEEQRKKNEEKIEQQRQKEEENLLAMNDNLNLNNNFELKNFDNPKSIAQLPVERLGPKTVAVYCIIENNKRIYQMAYPKCKYFNRDNNGYEESDIIIYNLVTNNIDYQIIDAHNGCINNIKHYYNSYTKCHYLLSTSYKQNTNRIYLLLKLWKIIHSNHIEEYLNIEDNFEYKNNNILNIFNACLLLIDKEFKIYCGASNQQLGQYDEKGNLDKYIDKSQIDYERNFIEAAYFKVKNEEKKYILLSGYNSKSKLYLSESYDCDTGKIRAYYHNDNDKCKVSCMNLFKKGEKILLINFANDKVNIFNFGEERPKKVILLEKFSSKHLYQSNFQSLCSISQKYIIASFFNVLNIIDIEKGTVISKSGFYSYYGIKDIEDFTGIEKIKIPEKGEYIITYSQYLIKIWKI